MLRRRVISPGYNKDKGHADNEYQSGSSDEDDHLLKARVPPQDLLKYKELSELDANDPTLFPNMGDGYDEAIKLLIQFICRSVDTYDPPLKVIGDDPFFSEEVIYDRSITTGTPTCDTRVGSQLDVVQLLESSHCQLRRVGDHLSVHPHSLRGKYVVVVCVFAPAKWVESKCDDLCKLRIVSQQLSEAENFEMVIVAKMRPLSEDNEDAFDKLVSAFHGRLFIPFEDKTARQKICYSLNFNNGYLRSILVGPTHKVFQNFAYEIVVNRYYPSRRRTNKIKRLSPDWITPSLDENRGKYFSSLAWILDSSYGDPNLRLENLYSDEVTTVGQLSNKLVGVYLFHTGDKLNSLQKVYHQCREEGRVFDIVLVCSCVYSVDPIVFHRVALSEVKRLVDPNTRWWVLPYNAATYCTLFNLCAEALDVMIMVGPTRKFFVDVHGGDVADCFGIEAYPFNKEIIVRKYALSAMAVTLGSLLSRGRVSYVLRGDKKVSVAQLRDKVVVVYIYAGLQHFREQYPQLYKWYSQIREHHSDFEVLVVYYEEPEDNNKIEDALEDVNDLLVRPYDPNHSEFIRGHQSFFGGLRPYSTLLFGKGGKLCALDALGRFEKYGLRGYPYKRGCGVNYIRGEVLELLASVYPDFMRNYRRENPYDVFSI